MRLNLANVYSIKRPTSILKSLQDNLNIYFKNISSLIALIA